VTLPRSIRVRLTLTFTVAIAVLMATLTGGLVGFERHAATKRADRLLRDQLTSARSSLRSELGEEAEETTAISPPAKAPNEVLRERGPDLADDGAVLIIVSNAGQVWRSGDGRSGPAWPATGLDGWRSRRIVVAAPKGPAVYTLLAGVPWAREEAQLTRQAALLSSLSLFVVALTAVGTWALVGRTLHPIDALAQQARGYGRSRAAIRERPRLSPPSPDAEVVRLVATLNELLDSVAAGAENRDRFYAAASHELRTPLHVLAGKLELTLSRPRSREEYETALREVQTQADRLVSLVQALLLLNRLERGIAETPRETVDVAAICARHFESFAPLLAERGLVPRFDAEGDAQIDAPETHVDILTRNLIENAVRYASPGGRVELRVGICATPPTSRQTVQMDIWNETPLAQEDLEPLFEPFYRPDHSRTAATGGNGLGLSLCRSLAEANGWDLQLRGERGGVRATVDFGEAVV
jgi:signal transduction histidine kinase